MKANLSTTDVSAFNEGRGNGTYFPRDLTKFIWGQNARNHY
jgi:hypothetical protein